MAVFSGSIPNLPFLFVDNFRCRIPSASEAKPTFFLTHFHAGKLHFPSLLCLYLLFFKLFSLQLLLLPLLPLLLQLLVFSSSYYFLLVILDHYPGLSNSFNEGPIYTSHITRSLVLHKFHLDPSIMVRSYLFCIALSSFLPFFPALHLQMHTSSPTNTTRTFSPSRSLRLA